MSMAINRQEIADTVFPKGAGRIMDYVIPKRVPDEYTPFDQLPPAAKMVRIYDPVAAKKLLAEAGYPNGFKAKVQYITASDTAWGEDALLMVKNYWAKIGVDLGLQRVDAGTMGAFRTPPYPYDGLMAADAGGTIYPILYNYHYTGAVANRCIISDPYIDKMIDQIKVQVVDVKKRDALIKEVFAYIMGQSYYIAFPQGETYTGWWPWLKEYSGEISIQGESLGPIFSHISLDQDLRAKMTGRKE
jgi:peptide/nickel transport system substrate-binding protein